MTTIQCSWWSFIIIMSACTVVGMAIGTIITVWRIACQEENEEY